MRRLFVLAVAALAGCQMIAPEDAPWEPLSLEAPIGLATKMKLSRLDDPDMCRAALATALNLETRPQAPNAGTQDCPLTDVLALRRSNLVYGDELAMSCPLVAAVYLWEREIVAPAAATHLSGRTVTRVDHLGTFACRNVYGVATGRRSEHSSANALDVAGFRLSDGARIRVIDDWAADTPEGRFLNDVRDGACKLFGGVLSPEYNAAHRDHFHLDMGPYRICS